MAENGGGANVATGCSAIVIVFLFAVWFIGYWAWTGLDHIGLLSHTANAPVSMGSNWMIGESKTCSSHPLTEKIGAEEKGYVMDTLRCEDELAIHVMRVTFWGRENQSEHSLIFWSCLREQDEFVCRELSTIDGSTN